MPDLNELNLIEDQPIEGVDFDNLPPQFGGVRRQPPQPGTYLWTLPPTIRDFETIATDSGPRLKVFFKENSPLTGERADGTTFPFDYQLSNVTFDRGDDGKGSEMAYLLVAVEMKPADGKLMSYGNALKAAAGRKFLADIEYKVVCSKKKDVWKDGAQVPNRKGCGVIWITEDRKPKPGDKNVFGTIPVGEDGKFVTRFECQCGADLRIFPTLTQYRPSRRS